MRKELIMSHAGWLDFCCRTLDNEPEFVSDRDVVAFVRARELTQRFGKAFSYHDHASIRYQSDVMVGMTVNTFSKEIAELQTYSVRSIAQRNCEYTITMALNVWRPGITPERILLTLNLKTL